MAAATALQVNTVGRTREETAARAATEAPSRSPERMRDWTRLWRLRRGPVSAEVVSGRRGTAERVDRRLDAEAALAAAALGSGFLGGREGEVAATRGGEEPRKGGW